MNDASLPPELVRALAGTYTLLQEIGRGGMGVVYAARDVRLDRLVAIKVLPDLVSSSDVRERFLREARAAARLSHPSIVPIYAADEREGVTFLVMAFVDGAPLSNRFQAGSSLAPAEVVPILADVARALAAAHQRGVIHRDVKPDNILVDRATGRAMVTDFGIARLADATQAGALTRTGQVLGTVGYMSPEQVMGGAMDGRSDLYSLGVVAFECLSGRLPFEGAPPAVIVAHATRPAPALASVTTGIPAALCDIVERCLRKDPADRYATGDDLAMALERAIGTSALIPARVSNAAEERILTEREAESVWKRAAELQAGITSASLTRAPTAATTRVARTATNGFRLDHVRMAALEAGISAPYLSLALEELVGGAGPVAGVASSESRLAKDAGARVAHAAVRSVGPRAAMVAGAPMSLVFEAEVAGELSSNDFEVVMQTIRAAMGEAGMASALGRTMSWTSIDAGKRRAQVSITATGGRTLIRAEEDMSKSAGDVFSAVMASVGAGVGVGSMGITMGAMHSPVLALAVTGSVVMGAYTLARTIFGRKVRQRAEELERLTGTLAAQCAQLIAQLPRG